MQHTGNSNKKYRKEKMECQFIKLTRRKNNNNNKTKSQNECKTGEKGVCNSSKNTAVSRCLLNTQGADWVRLIRD